MNKLFIFALLLGLVAFGCGKDDDDTTDQTQLLTGKIRGVDFTFGGARYGSIADNRYRVIAFNDGPEISEKCDSNLDDVYIDFKPFKTTDRVELDATGISTGQNTVVFHHPDFFQNLIIDRTGYYQITAQGDSTITIEMDFEFDSDNYMRGTMVADLCF